MQWVIYHTNGDGWRWEVHDGERGVIAKGAQGFERLDECVKDAESRGYPHMLRGPEGTGGSA